MHTESSHGTHASRQADLHLNPNRGHDSQNLSQCNPTKSLVVRAVALEPLRSGP